MRVLHFFKTYFPDSFGGIERTINTLANGSAAYGVENHVLSLSRSPLTNSMIVDTHMAHKAKLDFHLASTGFSREVFLKFRDLIKETDIIHYHFPWPIMDIAHLSLGIRKKSIITYHSDVVKQRVLYHFYKPVMNLFLSRVDKIVCTSHNYARTSDVLKRYTDKLEVIPIGLRESDYPPAPYDTLERWRSRFRRPFFLFVGVLRYYKGLQFLLRAAQHVPADILIVGEGPMQAELKNTIGDLQLNNVFLLGKQSDLDKAALLELCKAVVFGLPPWGDPVGMLVHAWPAGHRWR